MLIVLLGEPGLFVFASAQEATREIEPVDAEREVRAAFDDSAVPYRVEWKSFTLAEKHGAPTPGRGSI